MYATLMGRYWRWVVASILVISAAIGAGYFLTARNLPSKSTAAISVVNGHKLRLQDQNELNKYLKQWNFWENGITVTQVDEKGVDSWKANPTSLTIFHTHEPQTFIRVFNVAPEEAKPTEQPFMSVGYSLSPSAHLSLYVQINVPPQDLPKFQTTFDSLALSMLYKLTHEDGSSNRDLYAKFFDERKYKSSIFSLVYD